MWSWTSGKYTVCSCDAVILVGQNSTVEMGANKQQDAVFLLFHKWLPVHTHFQTSAWRFSSGNSFLSLAVMDRFWVLWAVGEKTCVTTSHIEGDQFLGNMKATEENQLLIKQTIFAFAFSASICLFPSSTSFPWHTSDHVKDTNRVLMNCIVETTALQLKGTCYSPRYSPELTRFFCFKGHFCLVLHNID